MREVVKQLFVCAVRLGAIGLVAVGASGIVAAGFGAAGGHAFVSGDPPGVTYSPARCADFLEYAPRARTCEQAATAHHFNEVVDYRVAVGIAGAAALGGLALARRRRPGLFAADRLPVAFEDTVAATLFAVSGLWLLGFGIDQAALGHHGAGFSLSGGAAAAVAALAYAARFLRAVDRRPPRELRGAPA